MMITATRELMAFAASVHFSDGQLTKSVFS